MLTNLEIAAADVQRDLIVPGVRVAGSVQGLEPPRSGGPASRGYVVTAARSPFEQGGRGAFATVHADVSFQLLELSAGRWRFMAQEKAGVTLPGPPSDPVEVDVTDREVEGVVIQLKKP